MEKSKKVLLQCGYMIWDPYIGFCSFPGSKSDKEREFQQLIKEESLNKGAKVVLVDFYADLNEE